MYKVNLMEPVTTVMPLQVRVGGQNFDKHDKINLAMFTLQITAKLVILKQRYFKLKVS